MAAAHMTAFAGVGLDDPVSAIFEVSAGAAPAGNASFEAVLGVAITACAEPKFHAANSTPQ